MHRKILATLIIVAILFISGCIDDIITNSDSSTESDYRQDMRDFVQDISTYAKGKNPDFIIIPQNGHELLTENGGHDGLFSSDYLRAIDGIGREDLYYGYEEDNIPTQQITRNSMISFMDIAKSNGIKVLVTDYCSNHSFVDDSYNQNFAKGYISFAANHRELDIIPNYPAHPFNVSASNITSLAQTENFLYLINPDSFPDKQAYLDSMRGTNYDLIIIDLFFDEEELTSEEIASLKTKANGGSRLVIAYMSIGEAEQYRYYWDTKWESKSPTWLLEENSEWPDNYKVQYWNEEWQKIIFGNENSYLNLIINHGFDGVYLDIIDAFEYFENQ